MIFISGVMLFALPWMTRNRRRKRAAKKCHDAANDSCQNVAVLHT